MKKIICIILTMAIATSLFGCSALTVDKQEVRPLAKIENDLDVEVTNDNNNRSTYLTKDKFFFVNNYNNSRFDDGLRAYVYDLKQQKISPMFSFDTDGMRIAMATQDKLYIDAYTYTKYKDSEWGYCLLEYNIQDGSVKKLYETPNTVDDIQTAVIGDTLIYAASTTGQDGLEAGISSYEIHILKDGKDIVILDGIMADIISFCKCDGKNYLAYYENDEKTVAYEIDDNFVFTKTDKNIDPMILYEDEYNEDKLGDLYIDGKFGDYYILDDGETDRFNEFGNGYDYHSNYYLYNVRTKEKTKLVKVIYTNYYA